jgi:pimeloyl-ACP methyl ester carboxylesterase
MKADATSAGILLLTFIFCLGVIAQDANSLAGDWSGVLDAGAAKLKLVLHFKAGDNGVWNGTMDSPDQGASGLKIDTIALEGQTLKFALNLIGASYEGTLNGNEITGKFTQGGQTFPLNFKRATAVDIAPPKRPQTPKPPFPYNSEDITFENKAANIKLAGTITTPKNKGPHPAVMLISGSGPQDRNESLLGHQPFFVLSDHLTRAGIAVLRFDDRGVGKSTGQFATATSEDFASDVLASIEFLKTRSEINARKIGLVGHSEGGMIGPMCAVKSKDVSFLVLMAGPGVPADELLYEQAALMARAEGANEADIAENRRVQEQLFAVLKAEKDIAAADKKLQAIVDDALTKLPESQRKSLQAGLNAQVKSVNSPWFRFFMSYDPRATLRQVKVPVLAINGELDLQVAVKQNLPEIAKALKAGGNKKFKTVVLPKLNHLFQTAKTGAFSEYARIEETIAPAALTLMSDWIAKQTSLKTGLKKR